MRQWFRAFEGWGLKEVFGFRDLKAWGCRGYGKFSGLVAVLWFGAFRARIGFRASPGAKIALVTVSKVLSVSIPTSGFRVFRVLGYNMGSCQNYGPFWVP